MKSLDNSIREISLKVRSELAFNLPEFIVEITNALLIKDDASLVFSDVKKACMYHWRSICSLYSRLNLEYEQPLSDSDSQAAHLHAPSLAE